MGAIRTKPSLWLRLSIVVLVVLFVRIENNPIVRLQAQLGLSPSLVERIFGVKSLFSGMTEGVHQFAKLNVPASVHANPLAPMVLPLFAYWCFVWRFPVIDGKCKEIVFFVSVILLSIAVNFLT